VIYSSDDEQILIGKPINSFSETSIGIPVKNIYQHIFVTGSTGSGKTYTVAKIVNRLLENNVSTKIIIMDWHGEYHKLVYKAKQLSPYDTPINILDKRDIYWSIELLADSLELTNPQVYILEKIVREHLGKMSGLEDLTRIIENAVDESSWMRESRYALLRRLSPLTHGKYRELFEPDNGENNMSIVDEQALIIDVSNISDHRVRKTYVSLYLKKIFMELNSISGNGLLIVLEEAHNLLDRSKPVSFIASMLAEVRKFNAGLVIVSQSPSRLLEDVMINTNTKIIHSIKSSIDLDIVNKVLYLPHDYQKIIPYLETGEAILYTRGLKKPVIIKIE